MARTDYGVDATIVAANTSMRPVEVKHLRRCDVDLVKKVLNVRGSKNESSHRVIPLNASSEARDRHQAAPNHVNAHAISDLAFQNYYSVRVRKLRCSSKC
jgi:integrase